MFYKCTVSVIHAMWLAEPLAFQIDKTINRKTSHILKAIGLLHT